MGGTWKVLWETLKATVGHPGRAAIWGLMLLLLILGGLSVAYWWFLLRDRVSTDNAYALADTARVSARVPGRVQRVMVENDQPVLQGQLLLELDRTDYLVALERAEALLARTEADMRAAEALLSLTDRQTAAQVDAARTLPPEARDKRSELLHRVQELEKRREAALAEFQEVQRDKHRFESLFEAQVVPKRQKDQVVTAFQKARAQLQAVEAEIEAVRASIQALEKTWSRAKAQLEAAESDRSQVEIQQHRLASLGAQRREAKAALDAARLNLSYCDVKAPISGYVAQKSVQVGEHVQAGQPLMAIVPLQEVYVEANFKETQLRDVRLGQPAEIRADMYPGQLFTGRVAGIRSGTGAAFSLLPPENATGNWIKVVQRIPVKILLDSPPPKDRPLRVGMSLKVTIYTHEKTGGLLVGPSQEP